jgi:hypothetical protein
MEEHRRVLVSLLVASRRHRCPRLEIGVGSILGNLWGKLSRTRAPRRSPQPLAKQRYRVVEANINAS